MLATSKIGPALLALASLSAACGPDRQAEIDAGLRADSRRIDAVFFPPNDAPAGATAMVPATTFMMGCSPGDSSCDADESPYHAVTLAAFEIDLTEVTQAAYKTCIDATACTAPSANFDPVGRANFPVVSVTWAQAVAYCTYVGGRLPTEAEWELAARGADGRIFPWGNDAPTCALAAIMGDGCDNVVEPVGSHPAGFSPYGVLDMAGNVWEWTADYYDAAYYASSPSTDPTGPASGTDRVYRGGSSGNLGVLARASNRANTYSPAFGGSGLGFRCVR